MGDCPNCGAPRSGRYCEIDGHDFETAGRVGAPTFEMPAVPRHAWLTPMVPPPRLGGVRRGPLTAVINADHDYYTSVLALEGPDSAALVFPPYCPERRVRLSGGEVRIGRRGGSEIDLGVLPEDPGVSHLHAVLLAQPDGTWVLVDPGSTNGTTVNGGSEPIPVNVPVPVGAGDRIHVGAWTTIMLTPPEAPS
ncbi:FHA domain-containing protein [Actinomadura terrae]|uniref:FHA domain-containing protein n=1 Tax=Actinomadura terrae TaxID=604353 RepID=UPI001FA76210|nr:FHA domain-containing protein [Actinomadura terrae]